jgi:hypothetical protein
VICGGHCDTVPLFLRQVRFLLPVSFYRCSILIKSSPTNHLKESLNNTLTVGKKKARPSNAGSVKPLSSVVGASLLNFSKLK